MIPIKIITKKQAIKLGLSKPFKKRSGNGGVGGGAIVKVNSNTGKETVLESYMEIEGKKMLTFMSKERKQHLKNTGSYDKYIKQFDIVGGIQ